MSTSRPLFRDKPSRRTKKDYSETEFAFLQRVDQPYWARVRQLIEEWFLDFPADRRDHIEKRLRSRDYRQFAAGFWELYLFEVLKGAGLVVEVLKEAKDRTPDFAVTVEGNRFFVEATIVTGVSDPQEQADRRRGVLLDSIEQLRSDKFTLDVQVDRDGGDVVDKTGNSLPILDRLMTDLQVRLQELDGLAAADQLPNDTLLISHAWQWTDDGWAITFIPVLLPKERWTIHTVPLVGGLSHGEPYVVRDEKALRGKLLDKLEHYQGNFQPLLIAVHLDNPFASRRELAALVGWPMELTQDRELLRSQFEQIPGVFFMDEGRELGGVALITEFRPWSVAHVQPHLWVNPNATSPLPLFDVWPIHTFDLQMGPSRLTSAGRAPHESLGLAQDWPGPEQPFEGD
jgi:hypothetical protein